MNRPALSLPVLSLIVLAMSVMHAEPTAHGQTAASMSGPDSKTAAQQRTEPPKVEKPKAGVEESAAGTTNEHSEHLNVGMILDYATFLVAVVTGIFAIFVGVFGVLDWLRSKALGKELAAQRKDLEEERQRLDMRIENLRKELVAQRKDVDDERQSLDMRIETFKSEIQAQEKRLAANQRFLEAVLSHHSMLLVGVVEGFGAALKPEEARSVTSLIFEVEAALDLFYPDTSEILKALLRLEQVGSDGSVSSLVELRDDKTADPEIRIRAQQVLTKVKERLKNERERNEPLPRAPVESDPPTRPGAPNPKDL